MSVKDVAVAEPFAPSVADEEVELRALCRALTLGDGFSLLFARCNQADHRRELIDKVREKLPNLNVQVVDLREPINHLLDELRDRLTDTMPDAVFVLGLEYSLRTSDEARSSPLIANLNASRNSFPRVVRCPMALWVPEYVVTAIARGATDFFSIRSGVYYFDAVPKDTTNIESVLFGGDWMAISNLSLFEKRQRIESIRSLLADYEALPAHQRDVRVEGSLHFRLGHLFAATGSFSDSLAAFEHSHRLAERIGYRAGMGRASYGMATIHQARGEYETALSYLKATLEVADELGPREDMIAPLRQIGIIHQLRGEYDEAVAFYKRSLAIAGELGDREGLAGALHQIGSIHHGRGEYEAALENYRRAQAISEELGYRAGAASSLHQIGMIQQFRGNYDAALEQYRRSLAIAEELGDKLGVARSLHDIGIVYQHRGEYDAALQHYQNALAIREEVGDRADAAMSQGQMANLLITTGQYADAFRLLVRALATFEELRSRYAQVTQNNLKNLRAKWGEGTFDAAWQQERGEHLPDWLK